MTPNCQKARAYLETKRIAKGMELMLELTPSTLQSLGDVIQELSKAGELVSDSPFLTVSEDLLQTRFALRSRVSEASRKRKK